MRSALALVLLAFPLYAPAQITQIGDTIDGFLKINTVYKATDSFYSFIRSFFVVSRTPDNLDKSVKLSHALVKAQLVALDEIRALKSRIPTIIRAEFDLEVQRKIAAELSELRIMAADGALIDEPNQRVVLEEKSQRMQYLLDRISHLGPSVFPSFAGLAISLHSIHVELNSGSKYQQQLLDSQIAVLDAWLNDNSDSSLNVLLAEVNRKNMQIQQLTRPFALYHVADFVVLEGGKRRGDRILIRTLFDEENDKLYVTTLVQEAFTVTGKDVNDTESKKLYIDAAMRLSIFQECTSKIADRIINRDPRRTVRPYGLCLIGLHNEYRADSEWYSWRRITVIGFIENIRKTRDYLASLRSALD